MYVITSLTVSQGCVLQNGLTALHWAALRGHHEIALDLIKMEAKVNAVDVVCVNKQISTCVGLHVYNEER